MVIHRMPDNEYCPQVEHHMEVDIFMLLCGIDLKPYYIWRLFIIACYLVMAAHMIQMAPSPSSI